MPDVVLCDIGLPGMNGHEVARAIRADRTLRSVYLVALTGYALPGTSAKAKEAGFDGHLAKPPNLEVLDRLIAGVSAAAKGSVEATRVRAESVSEPASAWPAAMLPRSGPNGG